LSAVADEDIEELQKLLGRSSPSDETPVLSSNVRQLLLDLAEAPALPIDASRYAWFDAVPGIQLAVVKEDPARGLRACLARGTAGARHPRHRHGGDELILVLEGVLRDERGSYGPGAVCHSRTGSVHSEEVVEDCLCYVLYFGELEMLE
jgi:anti-sigma factor ChrR (cupin superfamily)